MLILDTGPLLALLDADDPAHARCVAMTELVDEDLAVPSTVLPELDYWVAKFLGQAVWTAFAEDVVRGAYRCCLRTSKTCIAPPSSRRSTRTLNSGTSTHP